MRHAFYTVGHSTRTIDEFVTLLRVGEVEYLVDVRAMPRSRSNPQFNHDALPEALAPLGIGYTHSVALAGLRNRSKTVGNDVNGYWHNRSFHNYADYALSEAFRQGLAELIELGHRRTCAVMCAEAVWWRCHRRIIADHLLHHGEQVYHLMNDDRIQPATMTEAARPGQDGGLIYPRLEGNS
ncbi:Protein of unknown function, DUF488 [Modicisalibacter ilicicola DSM 19980]|uniref:DUF488 domain-containing protein n=1 Tax=Modicisalibacter ilicicola DSM 19980 TaxID=1121942 RepID=A0A1M4XHE7_9GAMM|nr:DUF488 domain-containing protein [Halomonas ilicicola]SHE92828.1 Protein of unknown function, DUF488 [Halomonas ilicicola DSM 19980]